MPHDKNGQLLSAGDRVIVRATVREVHQGEDFCNVTLESEEGRRPDDHKETLTLNAKVVEKV
jgi:hypothetical protein